MKYIYLILRLFFRPRCRHKWERFAESKITNGYEHTTGMFYILKCKKCGDMKSIRTVGL